MAFSVSWSSLSWFIFSSSLAASQLKMIHSLIQSTTPTYEITQSHRSLMEALEPFLGTVNVIELNTLYTNIFILSYYFN